MKPPICLDKNYSTTRQLFSAAPGEGEGNKRGGLRSKGYFKKSLPNDPLITVVTVVLNEPETLKKTMASVLEQTHDNIEYIVIDGGSTGATLDVIKNHDDKIDYWVSEPDKGIYDAMNKGIDRASGEWINFMNAGDYFYRPDTVKTVFSKDHGNADFIYGHTEFLGGDFNGVVKAWDFKFLWQTMVFTHQSLFTKSTVLKNRKFDTRFKICGDYNIIYNSYMNGATFFNSDTVIAAFDPGLSDVSRSRMAYEKWKVVRKYRNDFQFHWFYFKLFFKRLYRDINKRISRSGN